MKLIHESTGVAVEASDKVAEKLLKRGFKKAVGKTRKAPESEDTETVSTPARTRIDEQVQKATQPKKTTRTRTRKE